MEGAIGARAARVPGRAPDRLRDIRSMIRSIDSLTLAGQRHELGKIVGLLEHEAIDGRSLDSTARLETVESLLAALRQEARRMLPDVGSFAAHAEVLIGVMESAL